MPPAFPVAPRSLQNEVSFRAPERILPALGLAKALDRPGKPPGPHGPGLWGGTSAQNWVWSLFPSRPELLRRTALKHNTIPLSALPLSKASLLIFQLLFQLFSPLPTSRFSPAPAFLPALHWVGLPLSPLLLALPMHRCPYCSGSGSSSVGQPPPLPSPTQPGAHGIRGS